MSDQEPEKPSTLRKELEDKHGAPVATPSIGEQVKTSQTDGGGGHLPIGTAEQLLEAAPKDLVTDILDIPEWGYAVKVRSYTAAKAAEIKERGISQAGEDTKVAFAAMDVAQFQLGVIEPKMDESQVRMLHATSGKGFQRILKWLDEKSGTGKDDLAKAKAEFPGAEDGTEG